MKHAHVLVVGAGVIGCAIARELARADTPVTVIDRDEPGRQASRAAAGMLSPFGEAACAGTPFLELSDASLSRYTAFADALRDETSIDIEYRPAGKLHLSTGVLDGELRALATSPEADRFGMRVLDGDAARALEPAISSAVTTALLIERDHSVDNRRLTEAVIAAAKAAGAVFRTGDGVTALATDSGRVTGVKLASGERIEAERVVIAAGAWAGEIDGLPRPLPVRPVKGQMFAVRGDAGVIERVIVGDGCYIIPRDDGRLLVGATVEDVGFSSGPTPRGIASLMAAAVAAVPMIADLPLVETWAGFRPGTPDGLPIIGADPSVDGLVYATGHFRNGILLAPITAECVAALVLGDTPPVPLDAFAVGRFGSA
ncbi:glycine oxidase ThiO [soil metagenome]